MGGTAYPLEGPALGLNAVHHVALSYDGVQTIRLFLDGQMVRSATTNTVSAPITQFPIVRTSEPNGAPEGTVSVVLKSFNLGYAGIFGVNAAHSKFINLSSGGNGIVLAGNNASSVFDKVYVIYGRYGILTANADASVFHDIILRYQQLPFVVNGGAGVTVDNLSATPNGALTAYAIYDLRADVSMHGIFADNTVAGAWKGHIVADHPSAPFQLFKGELGSTALPSVAALTVDGGMGYIVEGTSFGLSHVDTHLVHLNAPLAVGAPHMAIGVHYEQGTSISDDPDVQLIGAGTN